MAILAIPGRRSSKFLTESGNGRHKEVLAASGNDPFVGDIELGQGFERIGPHQLARSTIDSDADDRIDPRRRDERLDGSTGLGWESLVVRPSCVGCQNMDGLAGQGPGITYSSGGTRSHC